MKERMQLEQKVFSYMRKHHMLQPGDRVVVGVSGGADSVCLLFVLLEWAKQNDAELMVVHVNHGIRTQAQADADYVEQLCKENNLPFGLVSEDVRACAASWKCSEEEAGRRVRYEAFEKAAEAFGAARIAVAHNSGDCAETMLFHLFRGSGIKGLSGIRPVRDRIIRPILCLERKEILRYLELRGIAYCEDATNAGDDYTRNRIRHHILPYAEGQVCENAVSHMVNAAEMLAETEDYLQQQTLEAMRKCGQMLSPGRWELDVAALLELHPMLQKRMLYETVRQLSPMQRDISLQHITALLDLFTGEGNRSIDLPFGIVGKREYNKVFVGIVEEEVSAENPIPYTLDITILDAAECRDNKLQIPQNEYTKWFDCDKIKECLILRNRKVGDYITIADGQGGILHKSIKDYMIDRKIPARERAGIPLVADGNHILWIVGHRMSEAYKVTEQTKRIMQITLVLQTQETESETGTEENHG